VRKGLAEQGLDEMGVPLVRGDGGGAKERVQEMGEERAVGLTPVAGAS
jgi:hypothetical protein